MTRSFEHFPRVTVDPEVMGGRPCVRGIRLTVATILGNLAAGTTVERLLELYPYLERDDVFEALRFGSWLASGRETELDRAA